MGHLYTAPQSFFVRIHGIPYGCVRLNDTSRVFHSYFAIYNAQHDVRKSGDATLDFFGGGDSTEGARRFFLFICRNAFLQPPWTRIVLLHHVHT